MLDSFVKNSDKDECRLYLCCSPFSFQTALIKEEGRSTRQRAVATNIRQKKAGKPLPSLAICLWRSRRLFAGSCSLFACIQPIGFFALVSFGFPPPRTQAAWTQDATNNNTKKEVCNAKQARTERPTTHIPAATKRAGLSNPLPALQKVCVPP